MSNTKHLISVKSRPGDCLEQIKAAIGRFSTSEKKLADFILTNPHLLRDYSSLQLAKAAELSQSSVVKFSQSLGYAGFTDLKLAINESVLRKNVEQYRQSQRQSQNQETEQQDGPYQHLVAPGGVSEDGTPTATSRSFVQSNINNLSKLEGSLDTLSTNERKLAKFLLQNSALIRDYSSQQVAGATGVSQSSVVKFSQKLGYKGFTDLKMAIHESVVRQLLGDETDRYSDVDEAASFEELTQIKLEAMQLTNRINDASQIQALVNTINNCPSVQIYGTRNTLVVERLAERLMTSGKPVIILDQSADLIKLLETNKAKLIVFVYDKQSSDITLLLRQAKKSKVATALISDHHYGAMARSVDNALFYSSDNLSQFNDEFAEASKQHLIDMLCSQLN